NYLYEKDRLLKHDKQEILQMMDEAKSNHELCIMKLKQYRILQCELDKNIKDLVVKEESLINHLQEIKNQNTLKEELVIVINMIEKIKEQENLVKKKLEFYNEQMKNNKNHFYELKNSLLKLDSERITKGIPDFMDWE
ncbi:4932_t:CDS:2, partial [Entrophospora sp. SA101]